MRTSPVYSYGDYDIYPVDYIPGQTEPQRYILTEGGVVVDDGYTTFDEAYQAFLNYEQLTECGHCGTLWNTDDVPVCPYCNEAVLNQMDKISALWHSTQPKAGDVLDITFGDDGRMIVKTYNLYEVQA